VSQPNPISVDDIGFTIVGDFLNPTFKIIACNAAMDAVWLSCVSILAIDFRGQPLPPVQQISLSLQPSTIHGRCPTIQCVLVDWTSPQYRLGKILFTSSNVITLLNFGTCRAYSLNLEALHNRTVAASS
jgi:hypothetical protein